MTDYRYGLTTTLTGLMFSAAAIAGPPSYTLTSLDVPGASAQLGGTVANGINNRGDIVGIYGNSSRGAASGFLYSKGKFTSIDDPDAGSLTSANGIDNHGEIVGDFFDKSSKVRGFILVAGHFVTIDVPGGNTLATSVEGINNSGSDIVGIFTVPRGNGQQVHRGFLLRKGAFTTIVVPNTDETDAIGVNNSGEIIGEFVRTPNSGITESFLSNKRSVFKTVNVPNSQITQAQGINNSGEIVGVFLDNGAFHGFVETHGNFVTVDFPGAIGTTVTGINDHGVIVGSWQDGDHSRGFIGTPVGETASR